MANSGPYPLSSRHGIGTDDPKSRRAQSTLLDPSPLGLMRHGRSGSGPYGEEYVEGDVAPAVSGYYGCDSPPTHRNINRKGSL